MKIIIQNTAHNSIESSFDYLSLYSTKNSLETINKIYDYIYTLEKSPYIGRYVPELKEIIYILFVANCKQDFNHILKIHNYFNNYLDF